MTLRKLERSEVVDFQTYVDGREATRALALAERRGGGSTWAST
jgi:hypothetical protein